MTVLIVCASLCQAAQKNSWGTSDRRDTLPTCALLSLKDAPASEEGLRAFQDRLFQEAFKARRWRLMERQRVDALLSERAFEGASSCSTSCASNVGSLLGVKTLLVPEFDRTNGVNRASLRELDVSSGEVLRLAEAETDEPLDRSNRSLAHLLIARLLEDPDVPENDSGAISITTTPPTTVWVDGIEVGQSPISVPAWPGTHRVAVTAGQTIPPPPEPRPVEPDVTATTVIVVHNDYHGSYHGHHHGYGERYRSEERYPAHGRSSSHDDAAVVGAVAAVAGAALVVAATNMDDSVWSDTWHDVRVKTGDTVHTEFHQQENDGKATVGIIGGIALVLGIIVLVLAAGGH